MASLKFENFAEIAEHVEAQEDQRVKNSKQRQLEEWRKEKIRVARHLESFFSVDLETAINMIIGSEDIPQEWTGPKHVWYLNIDGLPSGILVFSEIRFDGVISVSVGTAKRSRTVSNLIALVNEVKELQPKNLD